MAHYVAELMEAARTAASDQRQVAEDRCAKAILELWSHRRSLSHRYVPMDLGALSAVLQRLDPSNPRPFYLPGPWEKIANEAVDGRTGEAESIWLRMAEQVDLAARYLIVAALSKAAETQIEPAVQWVKLAEAAGVDEGADIQLLRRLIGINSQRDTSNTAENAALRDRLNSLCDLRNAIEALESEWLSQLAQPEIEVASTLTSNVKETD